MYDIGKNIEFSCKLAVFAIAARHDSGKIRSWRFFEQQIVVESLTWQKAIRIPGKSNMRLMVTSVIFFLSLYVQAQAQKSIPDALRYYIDNRITVGIAASILENGKSQDFLFGYKDYDSQQKIDEKTYFGLGSATKTFTATLLAREIIVKKIRLDQTVAEFFPEFSTGPLGEVSILQLATHTSGLPRMPDNFDPVPKTGDGRELKIVRSFLRDPYKTYSKELFFRYLRQIKILRKGKYRYSNVGFAVLSLILSKLNDGKSFAEMVEDNILKPLNIQGIHARWNSKLAGRLATKYDAALLPIPVWTDLNIMSGTGIIKVNLAGIKKWALVQLYPDTAPSPLKEAIQLSQKIRHTTEKFSLGLGWFFDKIKGVTYQNHNGSTRGFVSEFYIDHQRKRALIYLSNSSPTDPGNCMVNLFSGKSACDFAPVVQPKHLAILEDRYVVVEKNGYASLMIIQKHPKFDFYYLLLDSGVRHRLFYDDKKNLYFTEDEEYVLTFYANGHGELTEGVKTPVSVPFFRLKSIADGVQAP